MSRTMQRYTRGPVPVLVASTVIGVLMLTASARHGRLRDGVFALVVMLVFGGLLAAGGRSQFVRLLRGEHDDERLATVEQRTMALVGNVVCAAIVGVFIVQLSRGDESSHVLAGLGTLAAVTYVGGLAWFSRTS